MISKAQRIVDNLTDLGRETLAEDLSKRILECKSGTILREQDPCLMQFEDVKGHIELIRGAWAVTPWNIQLKLAEANSLHHMMVVNGLVKKHAEKEKPLEDWPEDASQELQAAIEQLVPILKEKDKSSVGTHTFHGDRVSFAHTFNIMMQPVLQAAKSSGQPSLLQDDFALDIGDVLPEPAAEGRTSAENRVSKELKGAFEACVLQVSATIEGFSR